MGSDKPRQARTAEKIADYRNDSVFTDNGTTLVDYESLREQIESYATEYAEEKIREERIRAREDNFYMQSHKQVFAEGYKAGQIAMRERAASEVNSFMYEKGLSTVLIDLAERIRSLPIEGKESK